MIHTTTPEALSIGSTIASNPPGPKPSHFKVLGNSQRGFQVWRSRDGLSWIPIGESHSSYEEMATAFAEDHPRPAEIHDPVFAAAYATQSRRPG